MPFSPTIGVSGASTDIKNTKTSPATNQRLPGLSHSTERLREMAG